MTGERPGAPRRDRSVRVLVTAASRYGATDGIARAIGEELARRGLTAVVLPPEDVGSIGEYDAVVLGSAVYGGHWLKPARELITRSAAALDELPVWLFSSGPVGDRARRPVSWLTSEPAELPGLAAVTSALDHRIFPGKLDPKRLSLTQKLRLLPVRGLEGDFRDWAAVREWADEIAAQLTTPGILRATG